MNPLELAQEGAAIGSRPLRHNRLAEPAVAHCDIRADKDHAWRRRVRELCRVGGAVISLMISDALALALGVLSTGAAATAFPPNALEVEALYLLPSETIAAFLTLQILALAALGTYGARSSYAVLRVGFASLLASTLFFLGLSSYSNINLSWQAVVVTGGSAMIALLVSRRVARICREKMRQAGLGLRRVALITTQDSVAKDAQRIARQSNSHVRVCETVVVERPTNGGRKRALQALDEIARNPALAGIVVSVDAPAKLVRAVLDGCQERALPIFVVPPFRQVFTADVRAVINGPVTILELVKAVPRLPEMAVKRALDIFGAAVGLLLLAPVFLVLSVLIKLDSPGPVFFRQTRVGLGGRPFTMLKFRTMVDGADARKKEVAHLNGSGDRRLFKIESDPRVTRLGHLLRRFSLDELPQLVNVLRREMSLVGPRPFFTDDLELYEPHHFQRYTVLPGMTGQWQINGRSQLKDFDAVVAQDLDYIRNWSIGRDVKILLRTLPAVFRANGAM